MGDSDDEEMPLLINNETEEIDLTDILQESSTPSVLSRWFSRANGASRTRTSQLNRAASTIESVPIQDQEAQALYTRSSLRHTGTENDTGGGNSPDHEEVDDNTTSPNTFMGRIGRCMRCPRCRCRSRSRLPDMGWIVYCQACAFMWALLSFMFLRRFPTIIALTFLIWLITLFASFIYHTTQVIRGAVGTQSRNPLSEPARTYRTRQGDQIPWRSLAMMMNDRDFTEDDYEHLLALDEDTPTQVLQRASGHEIERLPTYTYQSSPAKDQQHRRDATSNEGDGETDDPEKELKRKCSICLDYFENGQQLRILPCLHQFHSGCVDRWLSRGKAECPVCKVDIRNQ